MFHVYILESESHAGRHYVGMTTDVDQRLKDLNSGKSVHTSKYVPWKLTVNIAFKDRDKAFKFERYLKTGSGRAFAKNHF